MPLVFVYGTLKRGGSNHRQMRGAKFLAEARTGPGWTLYDLGEYPGLVAEKNAAGVRGELWEVNDAQLSALDRFEGVHTGLYARESLTLLEPAGATAFAYRYLPAVTGHVAIGEIWQVKNSAATS